MNYFKPHNRKELENQILGLAPHYLLRKLSIKQLWAIRARLLKEFEARHMHNLGLDSVMDGI